MFAWFRKGLAARRQSHHQQRQYTAYPHALGKSPGYVDNILHSMQNLLIVTDTGGMIHKVNKATLDLLGYTDGDLIGQSINATLMTTPPLNLPHLIQAGHLRKTNQHFRHKNGQHIPVSFSCSVMYGDDSTLQGVVCIGQDERETQAAENQLRYQAALLDNVSDAIISTGNDLTITTWNKAAETIYGWKAEEVIGKDLAEVIFTDHTDKERLTPLRLVKTGRWRGELVQRRKDGSVLHVNSSAALLRDAEGQVTGLVCVNHDITKRKEAEQELTERLHQLAMLRRLNDAVSSTLNVDEVLNTGLRMTQDVSHADHGFILHINDDGSRSAYRFGAYENDATWNVQHIPGIIQRVLDKQEPEFVPDVHLDPDYMPDPHLTRSVIGLPLIAQDGILMGVIALQSTRKDLFTPELFDLLRLVAGRIAVALDNARLYSISQKQVVELKDLYSQVSKLEQLKTDMIRIASHDLRNPVGNMIGYVELLNMDAADRLTDAEKEYIAFIIRSIKRVEAIIKDILSLERIHQMAKEPLREKVNLFDLTHAVSQIHLWEVQEKRQKLELRLPENGDSTIVQGDTAQLKEALSNLITNAVKYTQPGGQIAIHLTYEGGWVQLLVVDNGYGVPESQQPYLFEPFSRVQSRETYNIDGYGLGLSLVKNIVERHSGEIIFSSVYGEGSSFGFKLPKAVT